MLQVLSNGTSEMTLDFLYVYGGNYELPEGTFLRLTKVSGVEGNYGEAAITANSRYLYGADFTFDRAFAKAEYLTFTAYQADGSDLFTLKFVLDYFTSADNTWPTPESTPPVPTLPPVLPTPTPTPRPTLAPDVTEPPHESALYTVYYDNLEYREGYTAGDCTLRVYSDTLSAMTLSFTYDKALPEGTFARISRADGTEGNFAEAPITQAADGTQQCTLFFNQAVGNMEHFTLDVLLPDGTRQLHCFYGLKRGIYPPEEWYDLPRLSAPPDAATPTPDLVSATEPPYKTALVKCTYDLQGKVSKYSHYNTTFRQYADFSTLNVFFFYKAELPEGAYMRVVSAGGVAGDHGEAIIGPANVDGASDELLNAKIFTRTLPAAATLNLECCSPDGEVLFPLEFTIKDVSYPSGRTPEPVVTPYQAPSWNTGGSSSGGDLFNGLIGDPAPTPYSPTYNYNNWNNWYGNPTNNWGGFGW